MFFLGKKRLRDKSDCIQIQEGLCRGTDQLFSMCRGDTGLIKSWRLFSWLEGRWGNQNCRQANMDLGLNTSKVELPVLFPLLTLLKSSLFQ